MSVSPNDPQTPQPEDRQENRTRRLSPAARLVTSLDGDYYMISEVAKILGKSTQTIRRTMYENRVKAPSKQVRQGGMTVYLYSSEDIEELRGYFAAQVEERDRNVPTVRG